MIKEMPSFEELKEKIPSKLEVQVALTAMKEQVSKFAEIPYAKYVAVGTTAITLFCAGKAGYELGQSSASHNPPAEAKAEFFTEALAANPSLVLDIMTIAAMQPKKIEKMPDKRAWRQAVSLQDWVVSVGDALDISDKETVKLFAADGLFQSFADKGIKFEYLPPDDPRCLNPVIYKGEGAGKIEEAYIYLREN